MDLALRLREQHGISVRTEWLDGVLSQLRAANGDATIASWSEAQVFEHIFTAFLFCDLNQSGAAALPPDAKVLGCAVCSPCVCPGSGTVSLLTLPSRSSRSSPLLAESKSPRPAYEQIAFPWFQRPQPSSHAC